MNGRKLQVVRPRRGRMAAVALLALTALALSCSQDSDGPGDAAAVGDVPVGLPLVAGFEGFADVPGGGISATAATWAGARGIVEPIDGNLFDPEGEATRGDAITWLYRASNDQTDHPSAGFIDVDGSGDLADAVDWAAATGVIDAPASDDLTPASDDLPPGGAFDPDGPVTAADMAGFLEGLDRPDPPTSIDGMPDAADDQPLTRAETITMVFGAVVTGPGASAAHEEAVRLNQIQMMGTHNSYRVRPAPELFAGLMSLRSAAAGLGLDTYELDYGTRPLAEQFGLLGARQIELDVFADPDGGLYSTRTFNGSPLLGADAVDVASGEPALDEPGFKVLHIQDLDYGTHCLTFVDCLTEVRDWSQANPTHLPIMVLVEVKDEALPDGLGSLGSPGVSPAEPPATTAALLDDLDDEIRSVFGDGEVITPDAVRVDGETLRASVTGAGWPSLAASRGKVMFGLDNTSGVRDLYIADRPNLEGRMMFADVGSPDADGAAFFKRNDPADAGIPDLVATGFVVRTRADGPYVSLLPDPENAGSDEPRGVATRRQAWASGATWLTSDYLEPTDSTFEYPDPADDIRGSLFTSFLPAGGVARCNPVAVNPACNNDLLLLDL